MAQCLLQRTGFFFVNRRVRTVVYSPEDDETWKKKDCVRDIPGQFDRLFGPHYFFLVGKNTTQIFRFLKKYDVHSLSNWPEMPHVHIPNSIDIAW